MRTASALHSRIELTPLVPALLVGDVLAIGVFAGIGVSHHGGDPVGEPSTVLATAAPFLLGWFLVALVGGLYTSDAVTAPRRALGWTVPAWILAALVGQALRATSLFPGGAALTFFLVTVVFGGLLVVGWRVLVAFVVSRK